MIYLDNSATTPLSPAVRAAMLDAMDCFGNPSSLHSAGLAAQKRIQSAREAVTAALGIRSKTAYRLLFTSSGSEANNQILFGCLSAKKFRQPPRIVTTDSEHPSLLAPLAVLEKQGVEVIRLSTRGGALSLEELEEALTDNTLLLSLMTVNNETGALYDIQSAFALAKAKNPAIITHTDCVQGFLKVRFSPEKAGADAVTISAHKIHGPKGVGGLLVAQPLLTSKRLAPLLYGGGQEGGLRSGTENTIGIAGFGKAAEEGAAALPAFLERLPLLRKIFIAALPAEVRVNTPKNGAPHILSITLPGIRSETMLHFLSAAGIFVSSGSACSSNKKEANYVLPAFGLSSAEADSTLRISLSNNTTEEELLFTAEKIREGLSLLVRR